MQGTGTYVLEEGCDIQIKFGRLSEETNDGEHIWQGTVELTNVDATNSSAGNGHGIDFSLYGNLKATAGEQNVTLSGAATTVNAAIKAEGGSLNLTVDNSGKTTTFNKGVQVTALKVNDGSVAELTQESSAGNIAISTNGGNASLSAGITISGSMLSDGHIADAPHR